MNTRVKKAWQDLFSNKKRTVLVVVALILGLLGVGSIIVSYAILSKDLNENFRRTHPAEIVMETSLLPNSVVDELEKITGVRSVEKRDRVLGRIEIMPDYWIPFTIWAVEDFNQIKINRIESEKGAFPPPHGTVLIERDALMIQPLSIGDEVKIRLPGQPSSLLKISGFSFDAAMPQSRMEHQIFGYVTPGTFQEIYTAHQASRLIFSADQTKGSLADTAAKINTYIQSTGGKVLTIEFPDTSKHPHQFQLNSIMVFQGSIGLLAFILSAVLVVNLMNAVLAAQIRQIGIIKAIGGSSWQIMTNYLGTMLILGLFAGLIAIPLSVLIGFEFAKMVSTQLNFNIYTNQLPHSIYLFLFGISISMPVLAAFFPVLRASRIPVNSALTDYGITGNGKPSVFFSKLTRFLSLPADMAVRNSFRQKKRLIIMVTTIALGSAIFMAALNIRSSLVQTLDTVAKMRNQDTAIMFNTFYEKEMLHQFASRYAGVESIETWSVSKGAILKEDKTRSNRFTVRAVPPNSKMIIPRMIKGTWLDQGPAGSVVVNQKLADTYSEIKINEPFILMIKEKPIELKIVGIIKEFSDSALYMKAADFHKMAEPTNMANALMIKLLKSSGKTQETLAKAIERDLEKSDLNIRRVIGTQQILVIILDHLDILMLMLSSLAFLVMTVGALGMTSSMSISVMERSKEIAVLRTIGATPQAIKAMLTYEGVAIALMGWLLGVLFSYPVSRMVSDFFGRLILEYPLDYRGSYIGIGLSLAISIVFAILASRIPVKTATQKPIREVISYA